MSRLPLYLVAVLLYVCLPQIAGTQQPSATAYKNDVPYEPVVPAASYEVFVYPAEIFFGDPIYIAVHKKNISEEVLPYNIEYYWIYLHLSLQSDQIPGTYPLLHEDEFDGNINRFNDRTIHHFQPGESKLIFVFYRELPALEDMNLPFWEEAKKILKTGENVVAYVAVRNATCPITIKPRPGAEMELLQRWLKETPESLLPIPYDRATADYANLHSQWYMEDQGLLDDKYGAFALTPMPDFVSKERHLKILRNSRRYFPSNEQFIKVQNQDYFPYFFVRHGNRKPGDPACPETWRGWKELEESLAPSTMRDEIRLARIIIQYCDTKDNAVLNELKEWFDKMNEIQRMVMADLLQDRTMMDFNGTLFRNGRSVSKYAESLKMPFRDIYETIREYDKVPGPRNR